MLIRRSTALAACLCALAACAAPAPKAAADPVQAREQSAVDSLHLKNRYKDIVSGAEVKGNDLILYVDQNAFQSMDDAAADAMITKTFAQWKPIWRVSHPRAHGKLRVSVRNFYGTELTAKPGPA